MKVVSLLVTGCVASAALMGFKAASSALTFNLQDPKGVSGLSLSIDSTLEPVQGFANGVSGNVVFDPAHPEASTGTVVVDAKSLIVGSTYMTEKMQENWCLDVAQYPKFTFKIAKVSKVKAQKGGGWTAQVTGDFTIKDVTKTITVPVSATHLPKSIKKRGGLEVDGDLLLIRSNFTFSRQDFGVAPDLSLIGNDVKVNLAFVGVAPESK